MSPYSKLFHQYKPGHSQLIVSQPLGGVDRQAPQQGVPPSNHRWRRGRVSPSNQRRRRGRVSPSNHRWRCGRVSPTNHRWRCGRISRTNHRWRYGRVSPTNHRWRRGRASQFTERWHRGGFVSKGISGFFAVRFARRNISDRRHSFVTIVVVIGIEGDVFCRSLL
jgi:hypothetical protein